MDSDGYARRRAEMVEFQLRGRGIGDESVLTAMAALPRERFVSPDVRDVAYTDNALPIAAGQTISQPYMVARMTELLRPRPGMRVLEVGTGSGYQAAVLAVIGCLVITIERHAELAAAAAARLTELGFADRVRVAVGDGSLGRPDEAPFEGILVAAAAPAIPETLRAQLDDGGRLVVPVGPSGRQELLLVVRHGATFEVHDCGPCVFVPLIGAGGYAEAHPGRPRWPWRWRL